MWAKWAIPVFASILVFSFSYPLDTQIADAHTVCSSNASCNDNNQCTTDICRSSGSFFNPHRHCVNIVNVGASCNDGDACTQAESCDSNARCGGGTPVSCDDGDACTADSCDSNTGCQNTPISCDDNNECTADSCDINTGCANTNLSFGTVCSLGFCDGAGTCLIEVPVDPKPGSDPNSVNCKNTKGTVPYAVFTTDNFNAIEIEIVSMSLVGSPPIQVPVTEKHGKLHPEDVDGDGDLDAILHLDKAGVCEATSSFPLKESVAVSLIGETTGGDDWGGIDTLRIVRSGR